jgi:predicted TIM-barrel fold metal-dependent hydrolase
MIARNRFAERPTEVDYPYFDADNHYYEAEDAFTRYASDAMRRRRFVRWLTENDGKRRRLFFGGREADVIGNPTFNPVAQPGAFHQTLKSIEAGFTRNAASYGELQPIDAAYRHRDARVATMDRQNLEKAFLFPTLGVTVEGFINDDREMLYDCFHAFNRWLDEDWGFSYRDRIYSAPYLCLLDVDRAVAELEWVLERGARIVTIRPGPAYGRSPADPHFDPFWARVNESGIVVAYHALEGPSLYTEHFRRAWAAPPGEVSMEARILERVVASLDHAIMDTLAALVLHNLFGRFPKVRVASVELGAGWVPYLVHRLDHAGGLVDRRITAFGQSLSGRPSETFREHVWVSPFPEEDLSQLADCIGVDRVLFGSDWPHAEGTPEPADYLDALKTFDGGAVKRIMRDNALELLGA